MAPFFMVRREEKEDEGAKFEFFEKFESDRSVGEEGKAKLKVVSSKKGVMWWGREKMTERDDFGSSDFAIFRRSVDGEEHWDFLFLGKERLMGKGKPQVMVRVSLVMEKS